MLNIELLEKSIPVAPIKILALEGCKDLAQAVDSHLVKFRKELSEHNKSGLNPQGYSEESFIVECECPRFGTGEGKGYIRESVRGCDIFIMVDITLQRYLYCLRTRNHMSPDKLSGSEEDHLCCHRQGTPYQRDHAFPL